MSIPAYKWVRDLRDVDPLDKVILYSLADRADDHGGSCWPSIRTLTEETGRSRSTVKRHLKRLEAAGLLQIEGRKGENGRNRSNKYFLPVNQGRFTAMTQGRFTAMNPGGVHSYEPGEGFTAVDHDPSKEEAPVESSEETPPPRAQGARDGTAGGGGDFGYGERQHELSESTVHDERTLAVRDVLRGLPEWTLYPSARLYPQIQHAQRPDQWTQSIMSDVVRVLTQHPALTSDRDTVKEVVRVVERLARTAINPPDGCKSPLDLDKWGVRGILTSRLDDLCPAQDSPLPPLPARYTRICLDELDRMQSELRSCHRAQVDKQEEADRAWKRNTQEEAIRRLGLDLASVQDEHLPSCPTGMREQTHQVKIFA